MPVAGSLKFLHPEVCQDVIVASRWAMLVQRLSPALPEGHTAEPRVHLGRYYELDIGGCEEDENGTPRAGPGSGGVATALLASEEVAAPIPPPRGKPFGEKNP